MSDNQTRSVLILGASSGFGEAAALEFARSGYDVYGVHLDRRAGLKHVEEIQAEIERLGRASRFFNINAASPDKRAQVLDEIAAEAPTGSVRVLMHSLAFGTLRPFVAANPADGMGPEQMDMTLTVMAHSLVYWTQGILHRGLFNEQGRIYAMTSTGSMQVWPGYGAVSAAKAALESHIRQLALELGPRGITANAICAGVTDTPALKKIPDNEGMVQVAVRKNPFHRLTKPEDVAQALVALAQPCTYWLNGNTLFVDGGEAHSG